ALEEVRGCNVEAALALHWLYTNGRYAFRVNGAFEQKFNACQRIGSADTVQSIGERRVMDFRREWPEAHLVGLHLTRQRHAQQCAAMECAGKGDHTCPASGRPSNLDGVFHRFGTSAE